MKQSNALASEQVVATRQQQLELPMAERARHPGRTLSAAWHALRNLVLWNYERGTLQYDAMVTLILLFIFVTPYFVNFKDKPVQHTPHRTEVVVVPDGDAGFIYQVEASAVTAQSNDDIRGELLRIIEPIAGEISITRYKKTKDSSGRWIYKVWVQR